MWNKLKDQLPAIIVTLILIGGVGYWLHTQTVSQMATTQQEELSSLRSETNSQFRAATQATQAQITALNQLLQDAIAQRSSNLFMNDQEVEDANTARMDQLADIIAAKMQPFNELPQSVEDAARQENAQIDKVSDRLAQRIEPLLENLSSDSVRTRAAVQEISAVINDQLSVVLTSELAKSETLNRQLRTSQAISRDSMILAQEVSALYVSSFENSGILTRILTLPANVLKDASKGSVITSAERKKLEEKLANRITDLQSRLDELNALLPEPVSE